MSFKPYIPLEVEEIYPKQNPSNQDIKVVNSFGKEDELSFYLTDSPEK